MNPVQAYNIVVKACRSAKLTADEHDVTTKALLTLKSLVEAAAPVEEKGEAANAPAN